MAHCTRVHRWLIVCACLCLLAAGAQTAYGGDTVRKNATMALTIYGYYSGDLDVTGTSELEWTDWYYNGSQYVMDLQVMSLLLAGSTGVEDDDVRISLGYLAPSLGQAISPDGDWPAESFFDVYLNVEVGWETFHNELPIHMSAMIDDMPPYFDDYETPPQIIQLFDESGIVRGEIAYWNEHCVPWSPPEANISISTSKGSDVAIVEDAVIVVRGAVTSGLEPAVAEFGIRPMGSEDPFVSFWADADGSAPRYASVRPMGTGDGWTGYLDVSTFPPEGGYYDFEARFIIPDYLDLCDTMTVFVDPTPPIVDFVSIPPDSIGGFGVDCVHIVTVTTPDEDPGYGFFNVLRMDPDRFRSLPMVDKNMLGTPWDSMGCVPAATASCLKYFAENGHDEVDNPNGDESQPEESVEEMAEELGGEMGTNEHGTTEGQMEAGAEAYLGSHGCGDWDVDVQPVTSPEDIAEMLEEFAADSEDVIILLQDTKANGDTVAHAVTLGSEESSFYEKVEPPGINVFYIQNNLDFMDPDGGGSQEDNQAPVAYDDNGQPSLGGWDYGGGGGGTQITGYMKISPPPGGGGRAARAPGGSTGAARAPKAPMQEGWTNVSSGPLKGSGQLDTLYWDTTGFPGGVYLIEVSMVDAAGHMGRHLRLAGIPEYTIDVDGPGTPQLSVDLKGPYPNPFNPATTIEYSIPSDAKVTLAIYDVSGALVRRLVDGEPVKAGNHSAVWDGRNEAGEAVASGVYLCTLRSAGGASSVKLILMR